MQTTVIPKAVCDTIDRRWREFVSGGTSQRRRIHTTFGPPLCLPNDQGGLRLREMRKVNQVDMMRVVWKLISNKEDLWVKTVRSKPELIQTFGKE